MGSGHRAAGAESDRGSKGGAASDSRPVVGAVLLAAGAGSRLGGRPKALLELDGVPLIRRQLIALSDAGVDEVVVVLGHHSEAVEAAARGFNVTLARNPSPDDGQAFSVRVGLLALSGRLDAVIVALADQPLVNAQDVIALIRAFETRGDAAMVVPSVSGGAGEAAKPGNPVIFEAALRDEWLAGDVEATGRTWRMNHPRRVSWFDTDNIHYLMDIDTPDDLRRFAERTGHELRWPARTAAG